MNQIINTNRAVRVQFDAHSWNSQKSQSSSADIYVPFLVKEILVKGVDLDFYFDYRTMYFTSSLVDGNVLGSGFAGASYDTSSTTKEVRYIFNTPRDINGSYSFDYNLIDNVSAPTFTQISVTNNVSTTTYPNGAPEGYVLFVIEFFGSTTL